MSFLAESQLGAAGAAAAVYVEDVFSTYLYTGTGASKTITNGIDLSGKGGLVWVKDRTTAKNNKLTDTVRGATKAIISDTTGAQTTDTTGLTAFTSTGFTIGANANYNTSADDIVSWSFRKQAKFFDVVTWTGDGTFDNSRSITHSINGTVGCIVVKSTSSAGTNWIVWHTSLSAGYFVFLNATNAQTQLFASNPAYYPIQDVTSTSFKVNVGGNSCNSSGVDYVAYLFASNAGGFGTAGTDNVITCGTFTTDASGNATVNLGYEVQFLLSKCAGAIENWSIVDNMRGMYNSAANAPFLLPNLSNAETATYPVKPQATGFAVTNFIASKAYIYIAIRRGPMKTPTSGTTVFNPTKTAGGIATVTTNFAPDSVFFTDNERSASSGNPNSQSNNVIDKLRGPLVTLDTITTGGGQTQVYGVVFNNTGFVESLENSWSVANACTYWSFVRAPGFYDQVVYTGTGSNTTVTHSLGVVPEMMIVKQTSGTNNWWVYHSALGNTKYIVLNTGGLPATSATAWNNTTPTASVFTVGTATNVNGNTSTYIAYLFATLAGVSKVGTYTGTGSTTQTIDCGFTSGARFVLIKRTDSTGDWFCFDTANGMTTSSCPYLLWDVGNAQTTGGNGCETSSTGFKLTSAANGTVNINTATYIYLAIA